MQLSKTGVLAILLSFHSLPIHANEGGKIMGNAASGILSIYFFALLIVLLFTAFVSPLNRHYPFTAFNMLTMLFLGSASDLFDSYGIILFLAGVQCVVFAVAYLYRKQLKAREERNAQASEGEMPTTGEASPID
ncbi:MAG: hypothetical protein AAFV95_05220 [Bacteroidota bacterium]